MKKILFLLLLAAFLTACASDKPLNKNKIKNDAYKSFNNLETK
jgi:outer membrane biogenesis lipoprotein LolB